MTISVLSPHSNSWVFSEDSSTNPSRCCDAPRAMDHIDGYWHCDQQNRTWVVLDACFCADVHHTIDQCLGNCSQHTLMDDTLFSMFHAEAFDISWGDLIVADEEATRARETASERAARLDAEAAALASRQLTVKSTEMERYARIKAQTNTEIIKTDRGKVARIRKIQEPCKWLYLDEKAPKHEWRMTRSGKREPPYRPYLSGAECWAYEYHDPKTGKLQVKHTCEEWNTNVEGWCEEWNTNGRWRPPVQETRDFSCLTGIIHNARTPSRCSDSASTTSGASSHSHRSTPGAPRKVVTSFAGNKKTTSGFRVLAFDDSD